MKIVLDIEMVQDPGWNGLEFRGLNWHRPQGLQQKTKWIYFRTPNMQNSCTNENEQYKRSVFDGPLAVLW